MKTKQKDKSATDELEYNSMGLKKPSKSLMGSQGLGFFTHKTTDIITPVLIPEYVSSAKPKSVLHYYAFLSK